jgi:aryl-alcohol dehydrogenase-like predicted oxidoreductase
MDYRFLGRTGIKVSALCLGTMQLGWTADAELSYRILSEAFEAGINFLDTADVYSRWVEGHTGGEAETILGDWMRQSQIPRQKLVIATKVRGRTGSGPNDEGLSRSHILLAVEASLKRLGTDYIDLYQSHYLDENTPIETTLRAYDDLIHQGKVRYIGCSNYPAWRLTEALWTSETHGLSRYETLQPHYSLVHRAEYERELADVCRSYGLGVLPYSPLGAGFLTGKYRPDRDVESARGRNVSRYFNERNWKLLGELDEIGAEQGGFSTSQVALAWLLANPVITSPIIGPRSLEQLKDNLGAIELNLTQTQIQKLDEASRWKES